MYEFHGGSKRERERSLSKVVRRGGVLLTSYGLVVNCHEQLAKPQGSTFRWVSIFFSLSDINCCQLYLLETEHMLLMSFTFW